jgi:hypothetical protein
MIKGEDKYSVPQNYKTMMEKVPAFAASILAKLQEVAASDIRVPEFKKLCVSSYLVNLVTKTSTKFKINQYTSLLKPNRAFDVFSELKRLDPLATMVAGGASSRKRSRKTRRSRRRTSAQRGGSYEFEATRSGFLQGTTNFYNSLSRFSWDDDTRWDFLNFCYPYLEYVGDCGSTHVELLDFLKKGYDAQNGLVSNASSSSAASAGGGEPFSEDLDEFEEWYIDKLNELRQRQMASAQFPTSPMVLSAENVNLDESNIFGVTEDEDKEVRSVNTSVIQPATAPQSRPTTPIPGSKPPSGPPSYLGTPAPEWRLGGVGGGGGGTLSYTDFSPDRYSQTGSSGASLVYGSPMSQGRRSPTSSVASAAPEGSQQMQLLPGGPPSSSAAAGGATYVGAGADAQAQVYAIKNAPTLRGVEFVAQPTGASVAAGGGGMPPGASIAAGGGGAPAASLKSLGLVKALSSSASSSSSSSSSSQGPTSPTLAGSVRTRSGNVKSPKNQEQTGFRPSRKYPSKTRKARRSTTHRNRR